MNNGEINFFMDNGERITNEDLLNHYLEDYKRSKDSVATRINIIKQFFKFIHHKHIFKCTRRELKNYFTYLKNKDLSFNTKKNRWAIVKNFIEEINDYYFDKFPGIMIPKTRNKWGTYHRETKSNGKATKEEIEKILEHLYDTNYQHYLMIRTLVETGMRVKELVEIEIDNIDLENRSFNVKEKRKTSGHKYKYTKNFKKELEYFIKGNKGQKYLFISTYKRHYCTDTVRKTIHRACEYLEINHRITPHSFRKSLITYWRLKGVSKENRFYLIGHALDDVEAKHYIDFTELDDLELYDKCFPYSDIKL